MFDKDISGRLYTHICTKDGRKKIQQVNWKIYDQINALHRIASQSSTNKCHNNGKNEKYIRISNSQLIVFHEWCT